MALNVFELFGRIAVDSSGAEKGIDNTVKHANDAESKLSKTFKKIGTAVAAAFSVRAIVDFGKQCTEAYASIAAEESAFAQIMGDYADTAQAKLNAVADATGVTSTRLTSAMTSLTAKFKGLGYNVEDATTLATDGLLIATDAAAFWDMSLDESMSHLNSFINGSYEGGEAIGLFANDTQMAAYAIKEGIVADTKAWAALDEATKQATRLDYAKKMMEDSGATGQAAKEADAYANVLANLKEGWRQFQGVVGKPILEKIVLPAMQKLNDFLPKLTESVQNGIVWLEEGFDKIKEYFTDVFTEDGINLDALPDALTKMFKDLRTSAGKLLNSFGQTLRKGWSNTVWPAIQGVAAKIGIELPGWSEIETKVKTWWENGGFAASIADLCNWTLNLFGAPANVTAEDVSGILSSWWKSTKTHVQAACTWVLGLFDPPEDGEGENSAVGIVTKWWNGIKSKIEEVCQIDFTSLNVKGTFSDLLGAGSEVVTGAVDSVKGLFEWLVKNDTHVSSVSNAIVTMLGAFALSNPAILAITTLTGLFTAMSVDWSSFETNYPNLTELFEKLTGLDFTTAAGSMETFKDELTGIITWFTKNEATFDAMLVLLGGVATATGHPIAGAALIGYGASETYSDFISDWKEDYFKYREADNNTASTPQADLNATLAEVADVLEANGRFSTAEVVADYIGRLQRGEVDGQKMLSENKAILKYLKSQQSDAEANGEAEFAAKLAGVIQKLEALIPDTTTQQPDNAGHGESGLQWDKKWIPDLSFGTPSGANSFATVIASAVREAAREGAREGSAAGCAEGVGNIQITGSVTTGNVMLDGTALVGRIAPKVNIALGGMSALAMRG